MRSSYDNSIFPNSNIYANNINSSRSFFGKSSKLENLQNLYFSLNPYSKTTSMQANQQLKLLNQLDDNTEKNALDKKYGKPIINNYKRFHHQAEDIKKGKGKSLDNNKLYTNYTPDIKKNPNLAFYSVADLSMMHPMTYQKMKSSERYLTSGNLKNNTRLQMVDEKIKKLEEKNETLQVINNLFFDSLRDNLTQSLKRKGFLRKHLKDIEYLKQINMKEYDNKVNELMNLVEQGLIDFNNYDFNGEPLNGIDNMAGRLEALKTEIGTMLTKNTMKNDVNLNLLKQDVLNIKDELEKKLNDFNSNNYLNYAILKEYLYREEKDRLSEKRKKKKKVEQDKDIYIQEKRTNFEIKGTKPVIKEEEQKEETTEEIEESEVSTETNKNLDVVDKILLDSISLSLTSNGNDIKSKTKSTKSKKNSKKEEDKDGKEIELTSSSKSKKDSKNKKSKWKLLEEDESSSEDEDEDKNNNEINEYDENTGNKNIIIEGSYKSKFNSNKPQIQSKGKRSKRSKRFKLSKKSESITEPINDENTKEENKSKTKSEITSEINSQSESKNKSKKSETTKKSKEESNEENYGGELENDKEEDVIEGTESSSVTTESFKLTNKSRKFSLSSLSENKEVVFSSENSKIKNSDKKSKKSKKTKKKNSINQSIKERSKEEEDEE